VPAENWGGAKMLFLGMAVLGLILSGVGFAVDAHQFFHSYLTAYLYVLTIALGCLFFVMLQHLTRSGWSVAVRRLAEVGAWTLPFFAILFIPILFGMGDLFHWSEEGAAEHDHLIQHKQGYLNLTFFLIRAAFYFLAWTLLARYFMRRSINQDTTKDPLITVQMQRRAAPGIILFGFTLTFMAFDWLMSMDPHWFSTIFGVYTFAGTAVGSFAFLAVVSMTLRRGGCLVHTVRNDHYQDLGRWMFAFSVFWAYIAFSQFFLIWYGNIPEETIWYVHRIEGNWKMGSLFLVVGHFLVPFVLLMSRWIKRKPGFVTAIAVWMLIILYWHIYWRVMPNLHHHGIHFHWIDLACLVGVGGVFLTLYTRKLIGHALVPVGDPRLPESLALEHLY
jgi:hypothetical protein